MTHKPETLRDKVSDPFSVWAILVSSEVSDAAATPTAFHIVGRHVEESSDPVVMDKVVNVITKLRPIYAYPDIRDLMVIGDDMRVVVTLPTSDRASGVQIVMPKSDAASYAINRHLTALSRVGVSIPDTTHMAKVIRQYAEDL